MTNAEFDQAIEAIRQGHITPRERRIVALGPVYDVSLEAARTKESAARELLRSGVDPLEQKRALKAAVALEASKRVTFKEAAERCYRQKEDVAVAVEGAL